MSGGVGEVARGFLTTHFEGLVQSNQAFALLLRSPAPAFGQVAPTEFVTSA